MNMKQIFPIVAAVCTMAGLSSCEDMLDTKSDAYVYDMALDNANDSVYSALGILTQLQGIGERYVLLGELRGDLVTVPATADLGLQNVSNFSTQAGDTYSSHRDWYSVINNCNYALAHMDTTIVEHNNKVLLPEYAAIRTLRDWTYLQMGLTFGSVAYITTPITSVDEAEASHEKISLDALVDSLAADLEPLAGRGIRPLDYGSIDGLQSSRFFIRPELLLADLYLYQGKYGQAAQMYYYVIDDLGLTMPVEGRSNHWETSVRDNAIYDGNNSYTDEALSLIPYSSDTKAYHPNIVNLTYNTKPSILPAEGFISQMAQKNYYQIDRLGISIISGYLQGDVRGMFEFSKNGLTHQGAYGVFATSTLSRQTMIAKFYDNAVENTSVTSPGNAMFDEDNPVRIVRHVSTYRVPMVYLRYAEAVNRAGKPSLAFAVLKYGLRNEVMATAMGKEEYDGKEALIDPAELEDNKPWTDFTDKKFDNNYGSAMRGRGWGIPLDKESYVIPEGLTQDEKIEWVENQILDEMAAETCFEGHRFFDLLRIARHRADFPKLLVDKVSSRFADPQAAAARLSDQDTWWIK